MTLTIGGIGVKCAQDITTSASRSLKEKEQKSWSQEIAFPIWRASGSTFQQTNMKVVVLQTYWPSFTSLFAGRQPSYLSAGMSILKPSRLERQSLVTKTSAPFLSMTLTHLSLYLGHIW